jgi:hypothetical protein
VERGCSEFVSDARWCRLLARAIRFSQLLITVPLDEDVCACIQSSSDCEDNPGEGATLDC